MYSYGNVKVDFDFGDNREEGIGSESTPLKGSRVSAKRLSIQREQRKRKLKERCTSFVAILAAVLALFVGVALFLSDSVRGWYETFAGNEDDQNRRKPQNYDERGRYIVEDYDATPPFADFLPGLAGIYGKPLYAFYTNRGQGIASFGVKSKDYPILEFQPANKAYQNTALLGFRTFLQGSRGQQQFVTEPFGALTTRFPDVTTDYTLSVSVLPPLYLLPKRYMYIGPSELRIQEVDSAHGIETNVTYFVLPEEDFGAFVRRTTITNTAKTKEPLVLSALDGLARMEPAGGQLDGYLKDMGKTLEGFMNVYSPYENGLDMPFFRLSSQPSDTEATTVQEAGHYCLSMIERNEEEYSTLLPIIYDPSKVFGDDTALLRPVHLMSRTVGDIIREPQYGSAKTPSAFAAAEAISLDPGESVTITSFYGKASHILSVPVIARRVLQPGFGPYKESRVGEIVKQVTAQIETKTSNALFDGHIKQMFLDSNINGGVPTMLGEVDDDALMRNADEDKRLKVYHLFSRIHGDLERDYNDFRVSPTFFSEGPGRFNVLARHRRNDVFFVPRVGSFSVKLFLSLLQADGYNPHTVESIAFSIDDKITCDQIAGTAVGQADGHRAQREALSSILNGGPFRPGQLFELMSVANVELIIPIHNFIDMVAAAAEFYPMAVYESGFWADHWTYFMDFIDAFLAIYPDHEERLLYDENINYFFSPATVKPRNKKYVMSLNYDGIGEHIRQLDATVEDPEKLDYKKSYFSRTLGWYELEASWQHDSHGSVFQSSPIEKLILLATLKFASRDPYGMGIEYEAGKPGYNTAMNGIPSMLGSGVSEAYELHRLLRYLIQAATRFSRPIEVPVELHELMESINVALDNLLVEESEYDAASVDDTNDASDTNAGLSTEVPRSRFYYWDRVATAREEYRERVRITFDGKTAQLRPESLKPTFVAWAKEVEAGLAKALEFGSRGEGDDGTSGLLPTYFSYNVTKWKLTGPVRMMQMASPGEAKEIFKKLRESALRDEGLGMYTLSASLKGQSLDIGRAIAFAPGWLENQSVWLELSYRLYRQLLSNDMFHEFFNEMLSGGMLPFMDPQKYGRSLMECSAFVASSAFPDPEKQGRGFYARLSGATSEFLMMWVQMMMGKKPFLLDKATGQLQMQLIPALPGWLFAKEANIMGSTSETPTISFKLFGSIDVRYYNERRGDLFQIPPYRYVVGYRDGSSFEVQGPIIPFGLADKIRRVVFVASIDVYFC